MSLDMKRQMEDENGEFITPGSFEWVCAVVMKHDIITHPKPMLSSTCCKLTEMGRRIGFLQLVLAL